MMLGIEILILSTIFILILNIFYFTSNKRNLIKSKPYEVILIFSLIEILLDTIMYFICSIIDFEILQINNYLFFNALNALLLILTLTISLFNIKKLDKKTLIIMTVYILLVSINILLSKLILKDLILLLLNYTMYFIMNEYNPILINKLEFAKNQVEQANRTKIDFLSSMSHEIRTPLNAIVGLSEVIKSSDDINEIHEDAKDIVISSTNLLEIIEGILDISKIEANEMDIEEVEYNPIKVFNKLKNLINTRIGEKKIELRCNFSNNIPNTLYGDKYKLKQIITNLLTNAVKYTEKGYIEFNVDCINENNSCKLKIMISDTGRGIKREQMSILFDKFQRLDEDKNTTVEGVGLGLAITKSLTEMLGGKVIVQSEYGQGSKFTIILDQKITKSKEIEEDICDIKYISYENKKVLVVDDNKLNLKVAKKILEELNINVTVCESGFECLERVNNNEKYDIIFMDIMMPKMSGVDTLDKLNQIDSFNTPVVAFTADSMQIKSNKYIEVGFNEYLSKPIDKEKLKRVLNKCLSIKLEHIDKDFNKVLKITEEDMEMLNEKLQELDIKTNTIEYLKQNDIDVKTSLKFLGNISIYNEILKSFKEESKNTVLNIEQNVIKNNMKDYSINIHVLKSYSKYLGFKKLAELSKIQEIKSRENDSNYISNHYNELIEEYNRITKVIEKYI